MRVDMTPKEYQAYVKRMQKKSPLGKDMALAFVLFGLVAGYFYSRLCGMRLCRSL